MPRFICKVIVNNVPQYFEWSTIVDAPVSYGMSLDVFKAYYKDRYGTSGMFELDQRLKRVEEKGTSSYMDNSVEDLIICNRAGENESELTYDELIKQYFSDPPITEIKELQLQ